MNNIMKLADAYAEKCADVREYLGGNAGIDESDPYWVAMKEAEAELEAAVGQLEKEFDKSRKLVKAIETDRHDWEDWPTDSREAFRAMEAK